MATDPTQRAPLSTSIESRTRHSDDLWAKAVASLEPELRELFEGDQSDKRAALEVVLYEAQEKRKLCMLKRWKITKKNGDVIILRDVFEKIIQCVDKFKALGNAAAEFAPGYASVPWGVTAVNDTEAFAAMVDGLEETTSIIARCSIFETVYLKHPTSATEHLKASLIALYGSVMSFLGVSHSYFVKNTGKRFLKAAIDPVKEIEDALKRVTSKQNEVERTAQIASMEVLHDTSTRMHDLTTLYIWDTVVARNAWVWENQTRANSKPLTRSAIIDLDLARAEAQGGASAPIAYFYCSRNGAETERAEPAEVLRCIARQLCRDNTDLPVNESLEQAYDNAGKPQIGQNRLDVKGSTELILQTLADNPATIVIDGLDELRGDKRYEIFESLDQIVKESPNVVKVFLTSRNDGDIVCRLSSTPNIYISAQQNKADIERFIDAEVEKAVSQKRLLRGVVSQNLRGQIVYTLNRGAQGMFRWVSLQIQNLCDPRRMKLEEDIIHELRKLPQTLSALYEIAFAQIHQLGPSSYQVALSALQLLLVAIRPISWDEILHILQVSHKSIQQGFSRAELLDITCNFLDDDEQQIRPRFAHQSVREYLETRSDFTRGISNAKVAQMCLHSITAPGNWVTKNFCYSSLYLGSHLSATNPGERASLRPLIDQLLLPAPLHPTAGPTLVPETSDLFKKWRRRVDNFLQAMYLGDHRENSAELCQETLASVTPVSAVCAMGLEEMLEPLHPTIPQLFDPVRIEIPESYLSWNGSSAMKPFKGRNCVMIAVILDHRNIIAMVRKLGILVGTPSQSFRPALLLAASLGRAEMIRMLLVCGADPNSLSHVITEDRHSHVPNHPLSSPGFVTETSISANTNSYERRATTAMGFHVRLGGRAQIQSPFYFKDEGRAAIHIAMHTPNGAECVKTLVEFGAEVNLRTSLNVTSLQHCLEYGNLNTMFEVFSILLNAGADASAPLQNGRTIAHVVAAMGHKQLIQQLLDAGADCSARDQFQHTPLDLAIRFGHSETAELLASRYGAASPQVGPGRKTSSSIVAPQLDTLPLVLPSVIVQDYGYWDNSEVQTTQNHDESPLQSEIHSSTSEPNALASPSRARNRASFGNLIKLEWKKLRSRSNSST
ncbi:Fc.00g114480.m01.CDS01 [Cosmosporella sp. VM-42]